MLNTGKVHFLRNVYPRQSHKAVKPFGVLRPLQGVGQDKYAPKRVRTVSDEPVTVKPMARSRHKNTKIPRTQNHSIKRQTVQVAVWVKPPIKAELDRIAKSQGLSISATTAALLEEAVRQKLHVQHAVLLQPIIEQAIAKQMRAISTRLAWLLVRVAFDAGQTRSLVTNILGRAPGMSPEILKTILENSSKTAKGNITRRTPQMSTLMEAVEQWLLKEETE